MNIVIKQTLTRLTPWLIPTLLIIAWQGAVTTGWLSTRILPAPGAVLKAGWTLAYSGELWQHLAISSWRAAVGFGIGGGIGLLLGLITGLSRFGALLIDSTVQMVRNVPHLALIPLVILWFGIDESAKIFLVALGTFFPIYLNTYHGVRHVDAGLVEMAKLRAVRLCAVSSGYPSRRIAFHSGWRAFCAWPDVADADCGGNHFRQRRDRLSGDECP